MMSLVPNAEAVRSGRCPKNDCSNCLFICSIRQVAVKPSWLISLFVSSGKKLPSKLGECQFDFIVASVSFPIGKNFRLSLPFIFKSKEKDSGAVNISLAFAM